MQHSFCSDAETRDKGGGGVDFAPQLPQHCFKFTLVSGLQVVKCSSRVQAAGASRLHLRVSQDAPALRCLVVLGTVLPTQEPEMPIDGRTFVSQHSITMKFTGVDDK